MSLDKIGAKDWSAQVCQVEGLVGLHVGNSNFSIDCSQNRDNFIISCVDMRDVRRTEGLRHHVWRQDGDGCILSQVDPVSTKKSIFEWEHLKNMALE